MSCVPLLTIAVPTYRRADLLRRCLASLQPNDHKTVAQIELIVSDNSPAEEGDVEELVATFSQSWAGPLRYHRNPAGTGAVGNFNLCIDRARGQYTLILHDDDYLLPGGIDVMAHTLNDADPERDRVVLFGVRVETLDGTVRRRQVTRRDRFLPPADAYRRVLGVSSFVRVPGLVVQTDAYRSVGKFRVEAYTTCDFDMAVRLFGAFGVRCINEMTSVYTVHPGGVTSIVFNPRTIELNWQAFEVARGTGLLSDDTMRALQSRWYHQFILAGTWRALRTGDRPTARRVLGLFDLPRVRSLGWSPRWTPVRLAFLAMAGGRTHAPDVDSSGDVGTADGPQDATAREW